MTPTVRPDPVWIERPDEPYLVEHDLDDTRLGFDALAAIASGRSTDDVPSGRDDGQPVSPRDVIASIRSVPGWAVIRDACWPEPQRGMLDAALASIAAWLTPQDPGMYEQDRSGIVTSAGAVTHLHIDVDESYLLQVHGRKTFGFLPPDTVDDEAVRRVVQGRGGKLRVPRERVHGRLRKFVLGPGQGVHVPFGWPHFTRVEDEPSVSISLAFQTERTRALRGAFLGATAHARPPVA